MASNKIHRVNSEAQDENFGLLANGSSGPWEVSIDETVSGLERWFAQIEGPSIYFDFELSSLDIIPTTIRFLTALAEREEVSHDSSRTNGVLLISKANQTPVSLVRDNEFEDRCFVVVGHIDRPMVRYSLIGDDSHNIVEALHQVAKDLHNESAHR